MIAWRRIRAALVLATVSAVAWGILTPLLTLLYAAARGWHLRQLGTLILSSARIGAGIGFVAGLVYALLIADLIRRRVDDRIPLAQGAMAGAGAGAALFMLINSALALMTQDASWAPGAIMTGSILYGSIGALGGGAIAAVARRGQLPPGAESAKLRSPDSV